ncbi:MAG TPA: hypothetical protein VE010_13500, partial [Thermoanaerobaculia bacterium]|nr:hypothetical protein [Thermoanaerobaculia bacterium]
MATAQQRAESFLRRQSDRKPVALEAKDAAVPGVVTLGPADEALTEFPFSTFIHEHQRKAIKVAADMMVIANSYPGDEGLQKVLDFADEEAKRSSIDLAKYALLVFITHHPAGRQLPEPPLELRAPDKVRPSHAPLGDEDADVVPLGAFGAEKKLDWYREDASASDHHDRWHVVYPGTGVPDPNDPDML